MSYAIQSAGTLKHCKLHRHTLLLLAVVLCWGWTATAGQAGPGDIPILHWPRVMSDWIDVTEYGANGSDLRDDTAVIQAALDQMMKNARMGPPGARSLLQRPSSSPKR